MFPVWKNHTPAASDGIEITKHFLSAIKEKAKKANVKTVLEIFPSKQNVYLERVMVSKYKLPNNYILAVDAERLFVLNLANYGVKAGYRIADATGTLVDRSKNSGVLYPADNDSHPTVLGYGIYAKVVAEQLQ